MYRGITDFSFKEFSSVSAEFVGKIPQTNPAVPETDLEIYEEVKSQVSRALDYQEPDAISLAGLFWFKKRIGVLYCLGEIEDDQLKIFDELIDMIRHLESVPPFSNRNAWRTAFKEVVRLLSSRNRRIGGHPDSRSVLVGKGFRTLKRMGFGYKIDSTGPQLKQLSYQQVCTLIEKKIERVGGFETANSLLSMMAKLGRFHDGTFLHARQTAQLENKMQSGTPWHYIYSLAVKHVNSNSRKANPTQVLLKMEEISVALAATLDVEPHSSYENLSIPSDSIVKVLFDTVIYDELFCLPQWQPKAAEILVPLWFDALESVQCDFVVGSNSDWKAIWDKICATAVENRFIVTNKRGLFPTDMQAAIASEVLEAITSAKGGINQKYRTPSDTSQRDACFLPLIYRDRENVIIQPKAMMARSFVEAQYTTMREGGDVKLGDKIGKALELVTKQVVESSGHSVRIHNEFYHNNVMNKRLEVDLLFETEEQIVLIECNKKSLTSRARGGHTLDGLKDLNLSFVKLTQQLAQHEAHLRQCGKFEFESGLVVELRGRDVEKIAVNFFDHGSLQSRDITVELLKTLVTVRINDDHPDYTNDIADMNRRLEALSLSVKTIIEAETDKIDRGLQKFAMSTWWLSIDQLQYLAIQDLGLLQSMNQIRHVTTRSGDLVYDLKQFNSGKKARSASIEASRRMGGRSIL